MRKSFVMRTCSSLSVALVLILALTCACSSDDSHADSAVASACERTCITVRQDLIDDFGVAPQRIDCADPMWKGDCQHCRELLLREFSV